MNARTTIISADRHALYEQNGYSAAILSGDLLFVSGQVGAKRMERQSLILARRSGWHSRT